MYIDRSNREGYARVFVEEQPARAILFGGFAWVSWTGLKIEDKLNRLPEKHRSTIDFEMKHAKLAKMAQHCIATADLVEQGELILDGGMDGAFLVGNLRFVGHAAMSYLAEQPLPKVPGDLAPETRQEQ